MEFNLKKDFDYILSIQTDQLIEDCINSLRNSMRCLARLHVQEDIQFKSKALNYKIKKILKLLAYYIINLQSFRRNLKAQVQNG